jgi:hypothetical protein
MIITMMVVIMVSLRVGQVTFSASCLTCCMNCNGLVFAIILFRPALSASLSFK